MGWRRKYSGVRNSAAQTPQWLFGVSLIARGITV